MMTLTLTLPEDVAALLEAKAKLSGETAESEAARMLRATLESEGGAVPFVVKPCSLNVPEKWKDLSPTQMLDQMDLEEHQENLDRAGRESSSLRV
jgi:plasmid stability protein